MIRFNEKSLIIEIPCCQNETPLGVLSDLQSGLIGFISIINLADAPPAKVDWALNSLQRMLGDMVIDTNQMDAINNVAAVQKIMR